MPTLRQRRHPQPRSASVQAPTILKLRFYHKQSTFSAKFVEKIQTTTSREPTCSCSRAHRVWIGADTSDSSPFLSETPTEVTATVFIFRSPLRLKRARELCSSARGSTISTNFRDHSAGLLKALAALCEANHRFQEPDQSTKEQGALRKFRDDLPDNKTVNEELRAKLITPLAPSEIEGHGFGYIYVLRTLYNNSTLPVLKIGFTKHHPEHRAHELASCLPHPEVVSHTPLIPHAKRVESIIHAELTTSRRVQECGQCGHKHREWFMVSHAESREIVTRWSRWILQRPYQDGKLSDAWQTYLKQFDFSSIDPSKHISGIWSGLIEKFTVKNSTSKGGEQIAAYLNACYYQHLNQSIAGLPAKANEYVGFIEDFRRKYNQGQPFEPHSYRRAVDAYLLSTVLGASEAPASSAMADSARYPGSLENLAQTGIKLTDILEQWCAMNSTKTGALSVSDPELGVTESPLGDAILLPVISLQQLAHMDNQVSNWIGYTPTHKGFQLLQEAFQRGEWVGHVPQFQLPKAFRDAGISKLPSEQGVYEIPMGSPETRKEKNHADVLDKDQRRLKSPDGGKQGNQPMLKFIRGEDADTFEFSGDGMDEQLLIRRMDACLEMLSRPGEFKKAAKRIKEAMAPSGLLMEADPPDSIENRQMMAWFCIIFNLDLDSREGGNSTGQNTKDITADGQGKDNQKENISQLVSSGGSHSSNDGQFISPDKLKKWFAM